MNDLDFAQSDELNHSRYIGTAGKRETFVLTPAREPIVFKAASGFQEVAHIFEDLWGNVVVWFASRRQWNLEAGRFYTVIATVKRHDFNKRGEARTVITRAKVFEHRSAAQTIAQAAWDELGDAASPNDIAEAYKKVQRQLLTSLYASGPAG